MPRRILPAIVMAQLLATSLWFAGNAVLPDLQRAWRLTEHFGDVLGVLTISVQVGFIAGTLLFALFGVADRFSPRRVFVICVVLGSCFNLGALLIEQISSVASSRYAGLLLSRFLVGLCLAGIYPVGMRIASGWYREGLGAALGWMVGALVVGTGLPHGLRAAGTYLPWQQVMVGVSLIALLGGVLMGMAVPNGPHWVRSTGARKSPFSEAGTAWKAVAGSPALRASVLGYFGHMWELYSFFALCPIIIGSYLRTGITPGVSAFSFIAIAIGGPIAAIAGHRAKRSGSARIATMLLGTSGICCLLMPWMMQSAPWWLFAGWLLLWGASVSSDSPQFSALTALNAPPALVGTVLLGVNCLGFSISVVSIGLTSWLWPQIGIAWVGWILLIGPVLGVLAMTRLLRH